MMKKVFILSVAFVLILFLTQIVAAQAAQSKWTWEHYKGVTHWEVDVTDDETACGGGANTVPRVVSIQHNQETADVSDFAHGPMRGSFAGNTLHIPGRTIPDNGGTSKLTAFDLKFTPDCLHFAGQYGWDYQDAESQCTGSTTLSGIRTDDKGCPEPDDQRAQITAARAASDDKESRYKDILAKDPKNFWANWDMAELKKKQKNYDEFFKYFDKAASNENIFQDTREKLKKEAANQLHLSDFPTPGSSPVLRFEMDELNDWSGGFINDVNVPKEEAADKKWWSIKYWTLRTKDAFDQWKKTLPSLDALPALANEAAGVKTE